MAGCHDSWSLGCHTDTSRVSYLTNHIIVMRKLAIFLKMNHLQRRNKTNIPEIFFCGYTSYIIDDRQYQKVLFYELFMIFLLDSSVIIE